MPEPSPQPRAQRLIYRAPRLGTDYWVLDEALADPYAVRERQLRRTDWTPGAPYRAESWPGMRARPALMTDEISGIESWVSKQTGRKNLFQAPTASANAQLSHNCVQVVAGHEAQSSPHTDSRTLCRYAGVLYLTPDGPAHAGTTFYRARLPDGSLGGNTIPSRYANLVETLGTRFVPANFFVPDVSVEYRFNRLLVYRADLIHSATGYFGHALEERRMAAVFFWMAS